VQYTFEEEDHGAYKPYRKTKASVRKNLQNTLQNSNLTPSRAVNEVTSNSGGYILATSSADLCRNVKQAWNTNQSIRRTQSTFAPLQFGKKDELCEIMKRCKRKGDEFVCEVVAAPEPCCVLAS
jgi:hypothetical protein